VEGAKRERNKGEEEKEDGCWGKRTCFEIGKGENNHRGGQKVGRSEVCWEKHLYNYFMRSRGKKLVGKGKGKIKKD